MKRYPKYKDSGALWLGQVPVHWPIVRYKYLFREKHAKKESTLQAGAISFGRVVFKDDEMLPPATKASYQEVLKGEYLINPINLNYDLKSLRTALSEIDVCVSPAYIVLRPLMDSDPGYLKYQLHLFDVCHMKTLGAGVRQTISFGDIGVCGTIVPPKVEQAAIASFLDRVVGEMDSAIASQERMIELLKERRSAIITQAVTKGLDPNAKMKDSGVPWLGQVPAHWEIKRLRFLLSNKSLKSEFIKGDYVGLENIESATGAYSPAADFIPSGVVSHFTSGDILFGKLRPYLQKVALAIRAGFCSTEILPLTPAKTENGPYLQRLLSCWGFIDFINSASYGSKMPRVDWSMLADVPMPCPPAKEAILIAEHLSVQLEAMNNAITTQEYMIELLKERRSAIITQAVTGQIDVR